MLIPVIHGADFQTTIECVEIGNWWLTLNRSDVMQSLWKIEEICRFVSDFSLE